MQSISNCLAQELLPGSLQLASPVHAIQQSSSGCIVRTSSSAAAIRCRKVILSVPTTLYPSISFDPPLPAAKQALADNSILGYYSKMIFVWDSPWWRDQGFSGDLHSVSGPVSLARDTSIEADQQWSITCFMVGGPGRSWSKLSKRQRQKAVWDQLREAFVSAGAQVQDPANVLEFEWSKQQYCLGGPTPVYGLNDLSMFGPALTLHFHNIHFIGTETSPVWKGYMEGAIRSGQRGAEEVMACLSPAFSEVCNKPL